MVQSSLCIGLIVVFLIVGAGFLWYFVGRNGNTKSFKPRVENARVAPKAPPIVEMIPEPKDPGVIFVSEPDSQLLKNLANNKPKRPSSNGNDGDVIDIPSGDDHKSSFGVSKGGRDRFSLKEKMDRMYEADALPLTADGVKIDLLKRQREAPRPKVAMGLSRLAQLGDPIRGDVPVSRRNPNQYGEESRREGILN